MKLTDEMLDEILTQHIELMVEIMEESLPNMDEREPHEFSPRFHRKMRKIMRRQKSPRSMRILKRAAGVVLCVGLTTFGLSMTAEASRVEFFDFVTQIFSDRTEISYSRNQFNTGEFIPAEPAYLPDGMKETSRNESDMSLNILYQSEDGDYLDYSHWSLGDNGTFGYDSEDAEVETIQVNGDDNAIFVTEDGVQMLIWVDWNSRYAFMSNLPKDELIKIAESVKPANS